MPSMPGATPIDGAAAWKRSMARWLKDATMMSLRCAALSCAASRSAPWKKTLSSLPSRP
jgi:hypothetical protein